ncbi:MAG: twin-arginine translocase TatA/TatE family subunit [Planctomycetota bacterium]
MFGLGHWELLIALAVVLLIFGSRLPSAARSLGESLKMFKSGLRESGAADREGPPDRA